MLAQWESLGIFQYVLPFLLIFALVFVILSNIPLFKTNKGVNVVIALAVSLMSLQFDFVSMFFQELFPRVAIALSIILVMIILMGLFMDPSNKAFNWIFAILSLIITAIVIFKSFSEFSWYTGGSYWWANNWPTIIIVGIIIGAIIAIIATTSPTKNLNLPELNPLLFNPKNNPQG
jgi:hypothetical protein